MTIFTQKNRVATITKKMAEYIIVNATKDVESDGSITYRLPAWWRMTEVMLDHNVLTGKNKYGEWIEYDVCFTDEATEILGLY